MPFDNARSGSNRDAMAAYHGVSPTEEEIDGYGYGYDYDYPASTLAQADSVSLPTTVHDEQWQSGLEVEPRPDHPEQETIKGTRRSTVYFSAILLMSIIPSCGMIAWIITVILRQGGSVFTGFGSAKIGGHLTQTQAKAIDFSCSALLSPLLMAGLNFIWFSCARVCVVNEHSSAHLSKHGVPLQSLARASRMSVGTYDLIGLWELFSAKTWRLSFLGAVALLSAIGSSALSNIIAYESFEGEGPSTERYTLSTLSDDFLHHTHGILGINEGLGVGGIFSDQTQIELAVHNMSTMLHELPFRNATLDSEGVYIGPNATDLSLDSIEGNVRSLHDIPGYRLTAHCMPTTVIQNSITVHYTGFGEVELTLSANLTPAAAAELNVTYDTTDMTYRRTGNPSSIDEMVTNSYFPAFDTFSSRSVYLIHLVDGGHGSASYNKSIPTVWGGLYPVNHNISDPEDNIWSPGVDTYGVDSYSLQCVLLRQEGFLEYKRRDDQTWFIVTSSFQGDQTPVRSFLQDFQTSLSLARPAPPLEDVLWDGAPGMEVCYQKPGWNEECVRYKNFSAAVNNFVYASGEAIRIMYNVAALNTPGDQHDYFYNVTGEVESQFYRITYVPALLLVALLGIIICSLLVTVLVISSMKTWSWKIFRQVDITRLVVDCVGADLANNGPDFTQLGRASDDELAKWAGKYRVGYEKVVDVQNDDGDAPWVRLRHTAGGDVQKPGSNESIHSVEQ